MNVRYSFFNADIIKSESSEITYTATETTLNNEYIFYSLQCFGTFFVDNFIEFCFGEKERLVILLLHNGLFSFPILRKGDTGITSLLSSSTINACNNNSFSAIVFWLLSFDGIFRLFISAYSSGNFQPECILCVENHENLEYVPC